MCSKKNSLAPPVPLNTSASGDKSRIQNLAVIYGPLLIKKTANRRVVAQGFHHGALSHRTEEPVFHKSSVRSRSKSPFLDKIYNYSPESQQSMNATSCN